MKGFKQIAVIGVVLGCLACLPLQVLAQDQPDPVDCRAVVALVNEQNTKLSGDLRRIQREIAALRADLDEPGFKDVVAGIGYILGLFGVAAFVAARRKE
ncbi:MAG: hypothetical protein V1793_06590 [Pseudomonadota bacterium]